MDYITAGFLIGAALNGADTNKVADLYIAILTLHLRSFKWLLNNTVL